ncbi:MAG TPA: 16S rRNA (cytidine(1402)-2'-O)-methyltransferase [Eubacteriaceae bacterium]|nr:16S rRNA (cytidine(1402)-2'-O)-methyltransferase [Eubacteriaceae bacterium]
MTYRAVETLKKVDLIAAEDTRHTKKLLSAFDIHTPLISYHEHNEVKRSAELIGQLKQGKSVALVSDAGMPAISDPGTVFVEECIEEGIKVSPLPGANAALTALIASGLSTERFLFFGFLPQNKKEQREVWETVEHTRATCIFYESPHRMVKTLKQMEKALGDRQMAFARELTKKYEEIFRGSISRAIIHLEEKEIKGEFVLLIEGGGKERGTLFDQMNIEEHVNYYRKQGLSKKESMKKVASDRNISKNQIYAQIMIKDKEPTD